MYPGEPALAGAYRPLRERAGLKTILNLRGESPKGYYLLEKEACARHGIELVDFQVFLARNSDARSRSGSENNCSIQSPIRP